MPTITNRLFITVTRLPMKTRDGLITSIATIIATIL